MVLKIKTAQQSVQWTVGILRHFRALSTPEQNLGLGVLSRPTPPPLTQTVGRFLAILNDIMKAESKNPTALYIGNPYDGRLLLLRIMGYVGFEVVRVAFREEAEEIEEINECLDKAPDLSLVVFDLNLFSKDDFNMAVEQYARIKAHSKTHRIPFVLFMRDNQFGEELANKVIADKLIKHPIDPDEVEKFFREYLPSADVHGQEN